MSLVMSPFSNRAISTNGKAYGDIVNDWGMLYHLVFPRTSPRNSDDKFKSDVTGRYQFTDQYLDRVFGSLPDSERDKMDDKWTKVQMLYYSDNMQVPDCEELATMFRMWYLEKINLAMYYHNL
jgi:hypothetical protein